MINLIPPAAKKSLRAEYWVRVLSVWLLLWSVALVFAALVLLPAYELIAGKVEAYADAAAAATEKVASYENTTDVLVRASQQARLLVNESSLTPFSSYVELFEGLQGPGIEISNLRLARLAEGIAPVMLSGSAVDRQTLASFRDRLLAEELVEAVDLPISNLAQDKDIDFTITVTLSSQQDI